jgi:hypothetical protein
VKSSVTIARSYCQRYFTPVTRRICSVTSMYQSARRVDISVSYNRLPCCLTLCRQSVDLLCLSINLN